MQTVRRAGEWLDAQVGADRVMMSVQDGHYLGMTGVGARIWDLIERPATIDDICEALLREFNVDPGTCRTEVRAFLADLANLGAVTIDAQA